MRKADSSDLCRAFRDTKEMSVHQCANGLRLYSYGYRDANSQQLRFLQKQSTAEAVEKLYQKVKEIPALNREFWEKVALAPAEKNLLTMADIREIKNACQILQIVL